MSCPEMKELLSAFLDGETSPEETEQVERHIAECEDCAACVADYKSIDGLLTDLPDMVASPSFTDELNRRKEASGRTFALLHPKALSIAATVVVVIILGLVTGVGLLPKTEEPQPAGEVLPNLDLLANEEFLGIGQYTMETSADLSGMNVNDLVYTDTEEGV